MGIIRVNYNAKELKLVTTLVTTQPQKMARGKSRTGRKEIT